MYSGCRGLFQVALRSFMSEIINLERTLGRRVICNATIDAVRRDEFSGGLVVLCVCVRVRHLGGLECMCA